MQGDLFCVTTRDTATPHHCMIVFMVGDRRALLYGAGGLEVLWPEYRIGWLPSFVVVWISCLQGMHEQPLHGGLTEILIRGHVTP